MTVRFRPDSPMMSIVTPVRPAHLEPSMRPRNIRQLIEKTFASLSESPNQILAESLLIRDGHYCGHKFKSSVCTAVWFHEEDQIKVRGKDGKLLMVVKPSEAEVSAPLRAA